MADEDAKVHVGGYKKADGTKVTQYERAPPGKRSAPDGEQQGDQGKPEAAVDPVSPTDGAALKKRLPMSPEEYLEMALRDQATYRSLRKIIGVAGSDGLVYANRWEMQAAALDYMAGNDPVNKAIIASDAASEAAAQIPENDPQPGGVDQFLADLEAEATARNLTASKTVYDIIQNALNHQYDDEAPPPYGKGCLVPHLQMAGLMDTALTVQSMQYKF
jgi:hypothetical protein